MAHQPMPAGATWPRPIQSLDPRISFHEEDGKIVGLEAHDMLYGPTAFQHVNVRRGAHKLQSVTVLGAGRQERGEAIVASVSRAAPGLR